VERKMKVQLTRGSVCMGDDVEAPHFDEITVPDNSNIEEIVTSIAESNYLEDVDDRTWSIASNVPFAIISGRWDENKVLPKYQILSFDELDFSNGVLKCHLNQHWMKPEIVFEVLKELSNMKIVGQD
jgi:hypothetical protein